MIKEGPIEIDPKDTDVIASIRRENFATFIEYQPGIDPKTIFVHCDGNKAVVERLNEGQILWREIHAWGGLPR